LVLWFGLLHRFDSLVWFGLVQFSGSICIFSSVWFFHSVHWFCFVLWFGLVPSGSLLWFVGSVRFYGSVLFHGSGKWLGLVRFVLWFGLVPRFGTLVRFVGSFGSLVQLDFVLFVGSVCSLFPYRSLVRFCSSFRFVGSVCWFNFLFFGSGWFLG